MNKDISQIVKAFSEFFERYYKEKINKLSLIYPTKKSLEVDYIQLEKVDPESN